MNLRPVAVSRRSCAAIRPTFHMESELLGQGRLRVAGVDEAGRGPLAGPVAAAAVIWSPEIPFPEGVNDSKKLSARRREELAGEIRRLALGVGVGLATVEEIEKLNILGAAMLAMKRAVTALPLAPDFVLVDGPRIPVGLPCPAQGVVGGDGLSLSIAAASILAKTTRDEIMARLALRHPGYGWERNQGYPSPEHLEALRRMGVTPEHRRGFGPVKSLLEEAPSNLPVL